MTELTDTVERIVRAAGAMARDAFNAPDQPAYSLKGRQDYLTVTDGAVERFVRSEIAKCFPGDAVLGEEDGGAVSGSRVWIIDPIDGTSNFARQIPHFCVSLGLLVESRLQVSAIYEPMHDELFIAERGRGAWCNGVRMQVSTIADISAATVEIGWSTRLPLARYLDLTRPALEAGCAVRRAGSGALGLAYVAAGRSEAYAEAHINAWDVAGALLLVEESGGRVSDFWSADALARGNPVLATNNLLATELSVLTGIGLK